MFETKESNMTKIEIEMETHSYKYETDAKCSQWYFLEQRKVGGLNSLSGVLFISHETKVFLLQQVSPVNSGYVSLMGAEGGECNTVVEKMFQRNF